MATPTEICNLALSHLGVSKTVTDALTERSVEAAAFRAFYDLAREEMQEEFVWPRFSRLVTLALVEQNPNGRWGYAYRYPTDCAITIGIDNGSRIRGGSTAEIPHEIGSDAAGPLIYTDHPEADLRYGAKVTDTSIFSSQFTMSLSFRLAAYMAPRLTQGDPFKLGERSRQLYILSVTKAQATALNEEQRDPESDGDLVNVRG